MGLDQEQFIALLDGGPLGSAYAVQKLDEMVQHEYPAGFPVRLALKDLELVQEVEQSSGTDDAAARGDSRALHDRKPEPRRPGPGGDL